MPGRNDQKNCELKWAAQSCSKLTDLFKKAKPSAEVAEDPEDEDTPNTAEKEDSLTLSS